MSDQGNLKKSEKEKSKKKKVETPTNKADRKPDTTAQSELEKEVETPTNKADRKPDTTAQSELEKEIETPTNKADRKPDTTAQSELEKEIETTTNKADRKPDTTAQSELEKEIETPTNKADRKPDTTAQSELEKEIETPTNKADRKPDTTAQSELEKEIETPTNKADRKPDTTAQSELEKEVETPTNKADRKPDTTAQSELEKEVETPTNKADRKPDTTAQSELEKEVETPTNKADRKPDTTAQSELEKEIETPTNKAEGNLDKSQKPRDRYVGGSDSNQYNSQVNKQTVHAEDEQSVNNDSEIQNTFNQTSGILDVETVKRIVKEELSKDKRSIKMQTGAIMSLTAFFLGTMTSYWWTPHYTNTTYVLSDNITQSSIVMEDVTQKLEQCQANLTQIKQDFIHVQEDFTVLKSEVTEVSNGITGTIESTKGELKEDYLVLRRDMQILTGTQQIHGNKYITYSETVFFLIAGLILEPLILFLLYKYLPWRSGGHQSHDANVSDAPSAQPQVHGVQHNRLNTPGRRNILDQICSGNLEESICILSFYGETQDMHRDILTSALQQKDIPIKPFLLQVADPDALYIPRCRYVFIFVDFNERNVILENPGQELGDKKVVTVKACQKMGADVFVIYTRDRDSSHLGDGKLYNKDLSAFTKHYLLKELTARNRGLSVNDETFSPYQKSHIRKVVLKK